MRELRKPGAPRMRVSVLGVGNWGSSLLAALHTAAVPVSEVVHPSARNGAASRKPGVALEAARLDAEILWLCVPDAAICSVAQRIARRLARTQSTQPAGRSPIVVHSSGALGSEALAAVAGAGARTASAHPMMSFPSRRPAPLEGVPFAVETEDASARRRLFALVRQVGGRPLVLPGSGKALYHAGATMASPLLAALLAAALECMEQAGLARREAMRLLGPMAARTVENVFRYGPQQAFSGPIARGDASTVALHLEALQRHPLLAGVYRSLAAEGLARLPSANAQQIHSLLNHERRRHTGGKRMQKSAQPQA